MVSCESGRCRCEIGHPVRLLANDQNVLRTFRAHAFPSIVTRPPPPPVQQPPSRFVHAHRPLLDTGPARLRGSLRHLPGPIRAGQPRTVMQASAARFVPRKNIGPIRNFIQPCTATADAFRTALNSIEHGAQRRSPRDRCLRDARKDRDSSSSTPSRLPIIVARHSCTRYN